MSASDVATGSGDTCVAAYEELRNRVLAGAAFGSHLGLVLLLREGVAAWISRCSAASVALVRAAQAERRVAKLVVSDEIHAGIVQVLANMALCSRGEFSHEP